MENYAKKGRGAIYWAEVDARCQNPIQLINLALSNPEFKDPFRLALDKIVNLNPELIQLVVRRVPNSWMTSLERKFAVELLKYNLNELYKLRL